VVFRHHTTDTRSTTLRRTLLATRPHATFVLALVLSSAALACAGSRAGKNLSPGTIELSGAGATFPAPLYKKWLEVYRTRQPQVLVSYDPIGSGDGVKQFIAGAVDFGASDAAMSDAEMVEVSRGVQLVPAVAGSIVLAYNLEGFGSPLKLTRAVYTDIFLGRINAWDDPRIQRINPHLKLPKMDIALVVRQDSSGTTYAFTNHLSAISDDWRDRGPGVARLLQWPGNAMAARGNEGVAGRIQLSRGAIGYVEYGIARRAGLSMAWLENKAGEFVQPHGGSGLASLLNIQMPENFRVFEPDPAGEDSYPIVTYSWLLLYRHYDETKAAALKDYVTWCLTDGQEFSESLGFVRLPPRVVARAVRAMSSIP
jgi:phosphate transport system substrate-binding protein